MNTNKDRCEWCRDDARCLLPVGHAGEHRYELRLMPSKIPFDGGTLAVVRLESTETIVLLVETTEREVVRGLAIGERAVRIPIQLDWLAAHRLGLHICTAVKELLAEELARRELEKGGGS